MSSRGWSVNGYGFNIPEYKDEQIIEFAKRMMEKHSGVFGQDEVEQHMLNAYDNGLIGPKKLYENLEDWCWDNDYGAYEADTYEPGAGAIIANIATRIFGIPIGYVAGCCDCCSEPSIMYIATYPWLMKKEEKEMSRDRLDSILKWILLECFGISHKGESDPCQIGYIDVEYWG